MIFDNETVCIRFTWKVDDIRSKLISVKSIIALYRLRPVRKMPSGHMALTGMMSCTFLSTLYLSLSLLRSLLRNPANQHHPLSLVSSDLRFFLAVCVFFPLTGCLFCLPPLLWNGFLLFFSAAASAACAAAASAAVSDPCHRSHAECLQNRKVRIYLAYNRIREDNDIL